MIKLLNDLMPYIGIALCLFMWRCEKFNTKPLPLQLTVIIWLIAMVVLYLADHNPAFVPVFGTVVGRYLWLLSIIFAAAYVSVVTQKITGYIASLKCYKVEHDCLNLCIILLGKTMTKDEKQKILDELQHEIELNRTQCLTAPKEALDNLIVERNKLIFARAKLDISEPTL